MLHQNALYHYTCRYITSQEKFARKTFIHKGFSILVYVIFIHILWISCGKLVDFCEINPHTFHFSLYLQVFSAVNRVVHKSTRRDIMTLLC